MTSPVTQFVLSTEKQRLIPISAMVLKKVKPMLVPVACMIGFRCHICNQCRTYESYHLRNLNVIEGRASVGCRFCEEGIKLGKRGGEAEANVDKNRIESRLVQKGV